jgi:hypothetical protein
MKEEDSKAIWDPLWEYILDDYDEGEGAARQKSRFRIKRRQEPEESSGAFDFLFEEEDSAAFEYADGSSDRRRVVDNRDDDDATNSSWAWGNGNGDSQAENSSKRHPWRRNQSTQNDDKGADNSMWDLFIPPDSNQGATSKRGSTKNLSRSKSEKQRSQEERSQTEIEQEDVVGNRNKQNKAKRKGLFGRFRRKKSESDVLESEARIAEAKQVQRNEERVNSSSNSKRPSTSKSRQRDDVETYESTNPLEKLFEVAETFDPWGPDSEASDDSTTSGGTDQTDDRTVDSGEITLDLHKDEEKPPQNSLTEIVLKHTPIREEADKCAQPEGTSNDTFFDAEYSLSEGTPLQRSRADIDQVIVGQDSVDRGSVGDNNLGRDGAEVKSLRREDAISRPAFPSDEVKNALDDYGDDDDDDDDDHDLKKFESMIPFADYEGGEERTGLRKRLVCCSIKNRAAREAINQMQAGDSKEIFPATRMISDDNKSEFSSITGQRADYVNGVMGVPSDRFLQTKGPQSLYAYDYESDEHMDVLFAEFGSKARTSLFVRKLGPPPMLDSASGGSEVVIKVEVSSYYTM